MEDQLQFIPKEELAFDVLDFTPLSQSRNWGLDLCKIDDAWLKSKGAGIKVAVLDTGISDHSDFKGSWDEAHCCIDNETWEDKKSGHGTHCIGIVGARDNDFGVIGVAPECTIIPIKVLSDNGGGSFTSIIKGIKKAIMLNADIISLSLGTNQDGPKELNDLIKYAVHDKGIFVIAAAGNDGQGVNYPARLDDVIAVAAIDENGDIAKFTSRGTQIDIVAPGVNIYSTFLNNSYAKMSGTSQACPFISGLCALILSYTRNNPGVPQINSIAEMMRALDLMSDDSKYIGSVDGVKWGFGCPKTENIDWNNI